MIMRPWIARDWDSVVPSDVVEHGNSHVPEFLNPFTCTENDFIILISLTVVLVVSFCCCFI